MTLTLKYFIHQVFTLCLWEVIFLYFLLFLDWVKSCGSFGYIIHNHMTELGLYVSHQPGDSRGGPWHSQLGDLTFLDHLHNMIKSWDTQDNRPISHAQIIHHYGNLVFVVPLDTGHFDIHHEKPNGFH